MGPSDWRRVATEIWFNIGLGNGLLPDGMKPLPELILTCIHISQLSSSSKELSRKSPMQTVVHKSKVSCQKGPISHA